MREIQGPEGRWLFTEEAVASFVAWVAGQVPGVLRVAGEGEGWRPRLGLESAPKGIAVQMEKDRCTVTVQVVAKFGVFLPDMARELKKALEEKSRWHLGFPLDEVEVQVVSVERGFP